MATFDFIEASSKGYKFLWEERHAIGRFGLIAAALKFVGFIAITYFGLEQNFLRHGLVLLPSFFAEGLLVMYAIRHALYNEDMPFQPHARTSPASRDGMRLIWAGTIVYVLIWLTLSFFNGLAMMGTGAPDGGEVPPEPEFKVYLMLTWLLVCAVWLFRFIWLYVPVAMGYSMRDYLRRIGGFRISLYMMGLWLVCYLPFVLLLMLFSDMAMIAYPAAEGETVSKAYEYMMAAAKIIANLATTVTASVAMAYGIASIMSGSKSVK
ncbi:MAG TPA: hypothetical protein DEA55_06060 [Rhodospirillaceae bacterium]|nr:hypothetical protein [Rhodospirillaceae bacterium]